jgi:hypothetical protein
MHPAQTHPFPDSRVPLTATCSRAFLPNNSQMREVREIELHQTNGTHSIRHSAGETGIRHPAKPEKTSYE